MKGLYNRFCESNSDKSVSEQVFRFFNFLFQQQFKELVCLFEIM